MLNADQLVAFENDGRRFASALFDAGFDAGFDEEFVRDAAFGPCTRLSQPHPDLEVSVGFILSHNTMSAAEMRNKAAYLLTIDRQRPATSWAFCAGMVAECEARR